MRLFTPQVLKVSTNLASGFRQVGGCGYRSTASTHINVHNWSYFRHMASIALFWIELLSLAEKQLKLNLFYGSNLHPTYSPLQDQTDLQNCMQIHSDIHADSGEYVSSETSSSGQDLPRNPLLQSILRSSMAGEVRAHTPQTTLTLGF